MAFFRSRWVGRVRICSSSISMRSDTAHLSCMAQTPTFPCSGLSFVRTSDSRMFMTWRITGNTKSVLRRSAHRRRENSIRFVQAGPAHAHPKTAVGRMDTLNDGMRLMAMTLGGIWASWLIFSKTLCLRTPLTDQYLISCPTMWKQRWSEWCPQAFRGGEILKGFCEQAVSGRRPSRSDAPADVVMAVRKGEGFTMRAVCVRLPMGSVTARVGKPSPKLPFV